MKQYQSKNFKIYKASAGSGKTFTIVKEYLTLCLGNDADKYRNILAVTFTNKAASEMKAKILRFLLGIIENSQSNDIVQMRNHLTTTLEIDENKLVANAKRLYVNMLHNYSDMAVCTIDSFVQHLSRSFARELDLPGQYSVILDEDDLIEEIIKRLSDEIGKDKFISTILSNFVEYNMSEEAGWKIKKPIADFIMKLFSEDAYRKGDFKNFDSITEEKYNEIKNYVHTELKHIKDSISLIIKDIEDEESRLGIIVDDYYNKSNGLPSVKNKINNGIGDITTATVNSILSGEKNWYGKDCKIHDNSILDLYKNAVITYKSLYPKKIIYEIIEKELFLYV
ncbi:MAG: UvrD-helicase domain-containing protein, partial [Bacteroidales bacterium]|nr:UvrD-helicase domain-containing protein [Bacteroidales bacterium]